MNVIDALNSRQSVRAYKQDAVSKEILLKIFEAANTSPSWADTQPWEIYVAGGEVLDKLRKDFLAQFENASPSFPDLPRPESWPEALKKRMMDNADQRFNILGIGRDDKQARKNFMRRNYEFFGAPLVVYLCLDRTLTPWSYFDLGLVAQSLMLAAQEFGIDSIPAVSLVAYPEIIRRELEIPEDLSILIGIALGYKASADVANNPRSLRRPVQEVVKLLGI